MHICSLRPSCQCMKMILSQDYQYNMNAAQWSIDEIISIPGGSYNTKDQSLKFDNDSESKLEWMNDDVDNQVKINSLMIPNNGVQRMEENYSEWDGDYRK